MRFIVNNICTISYYIVTFSYICSINNNTAMKKDVIQIRVEEDLKKKLQTMADSDSRKLSDFIRLHLLKLVENKGKKK